MKFRLVIQTEVYDSEDNRIGHEPIELEVEARSARLASRKAEEVLQQLLDRPKKGG